MTGRAREPGHGPAARPGGQVRYSPAQLARLLGLPEPTAEQAAVISAPLAPVAVIAGAGSGKSETMAGRLVWLVANGLVRPERLLGLTFTRKAAAELAQRVRTRLDSLRRAGLAATAAGAGTPPRPGTGDRAPGHPAGSGHPPGRRDAEAAGPDRTGSVVDDQVDPLAGDPVVSTYHSYAARLVADHALREALEPSLRLATPAVSWQLAARVVASYPGPLDAVPWAPPGVTAAVLGLAGELAEHLCDPEEVTHVGEWLEAAAAALPGRVPALASKVLHCQRMREQLLPLVSAYGEAKSARELIDYSDQMSLAARIATRHPEVGAAERSRYQAVLLDEYQDTSHAQLVLLRALFGDGHPVTAVGDPCQSIYGWRGASAGNLLRFTRDFPPAGTGSGTGNPAGTGPGELCKLSTSFRNCGRVLDAAAVIQADLRVQAPQVPRLQSPPVRAGRGAVTCALLGTVADEARWVAERIGELLSLPPGTAPDGGPWLERATGRIHPGDIAVLCRKRSQFAAVRAAIEDRQIPVEVVGLGGLLTVPEVADVVATLRVLHDPSASNSLARLLTGPRWRIGPSDLVALGRRARDLARQQPGPGGESAGRPEGDALAQAVADLTADPGSLVEALDDLGDGTGYTGVGYQRLTALAGELRYLRSQAGRPLPDLVGEVERVLGLDIEVAAQQWRDPATARADLDAFAGAAAEFADDDEAPTLGAFLAYLSAAEQEEFGLESGRPSGADAVQLITVHAAKGLEWPAVLVPGLSAGDRTQVFPAKPRVTTRWTENPRLLPFGLRGDSADLPALGGLSAESLSGFHAACQHRDLSEERRLAYVAITRAAFWVGCSGYWWGEGSSPLGPSVFLEEVRAACLEGAGQVTTWTPAPGEDAQNPLLAEPAAVRWPAAPDERRQEPVREAAAWIEEGLARPREQGPGSAAGKAAPTGGRAALTAQERALVDAWESDAGLLLSELRERRSRASLAVPLPAELAVSALVSMAADPAGLAQRIRRPMPRPPAPHARRGTAFHRWLEERFGQQRLLDEADLLGAADEDDAGQDQADLALLRERFETGQWGNRWPREVEVPFETVIAGRSVRGRIDAVFADRDGGYDVVDWKTGQPPTPGNEQRAVAVQLAAYRLAWSRLARVPLGQVRAAFYYVRYDKTVRPADLLDEAGLAALINAVPALG